MIAIHAITKKRLALGMSKTDLAQASRLTRSTICRLEDEDSQLKVHVETAHAVCKALGCKVEDIYRKEDLTWNGRRPHSNLPQQRKQQTPKVVCRQCWTETNGRLADCTSCGEPLKAATTASTT